MTNGEKFKEVFKTSDVYEGHSYAFVWMSKYDEEAEINIDWWNAEYIEPSSSENSNKSEIPTNSTTKNDLAVDCISRKAVQTRLKEIINEMETIFADIREREVNDAVCGLCEYDCDHGLDGFANECPGFEKDDCFKLNEKYKAEWLDISNLPPVTPQLSSGTRKNSKKLEKDFGELDCISRQSVAEYIDYIQNHGMGKKKSFDFIKKFVTNLSSVTPQPKIGR